MKPSIATRASHKACTIAVLFSMCLASGCREGVLDPHGPVGSAERIILYDATTIMLAVVVPVIVLTLVFAWWFRAGNRRAQYRPEWEYSGRIEMIVWSIPALVIIFLGGIAWIGSQELDPLREIKSDSTPVDIEVVSLDWRWLFIYPSQGIASINRLVVPKGVPIHFSLTSTSVMNSFFVPELGSQIYTMPGMTTQLYLQADRAGIYHGLSAQFSGEGFSDMRFDLHAVSRDEFDAWVKATQVSGRGLNMAGLASLIKPSMDSQAVTYGTVEPGLFEAISSGHPAMMLPGQGR